MSEVSLDALPPRGPTGVPHFRPPLSQDSTSVLCLGTYRNPRGGGQFLMSEAPLEGSARPSWGAIPVSRMHHRSMLPGFPALSIFVQRTVYKFVTALYISTSLIRNSTPLEPYSRPMLWAL